MRSPSRSDSLGSTNRRSPSCRPDLPACCSCGESDWRFLSAGELHACRRCGAVFNARSAGTADEEARYRAYSAAPPPGAERIARSQWNWVRQTGARCHTVLDVGCGYGDFMQAARADGARVAGVELDPAAAGACREAGLEVREGSLLSTGAPSGPWDVVTFWDVLEHLDDPLAALRLVLPQMAPGGLLVIRGRNAALHVPLKRLGPRLRGLRMPDLACVHRWAFDAAGYRRLVQAAGFQETRVFPGLPTEGDRFSTFAGARAAAAVKGAARVLGIALGAASFGRVFAFPSVILTARKPES